MKQKVVIIPVRKKKKLKFCVLKKKNKKRVLLTWQNKFKLENNFRIYSKLHEKK